MLLGRGDGQVAMLEATAASEFLHFSVEEVKLSFHNSVSSFFATYPRYGNLFYKSIYIDIMETFLKFQYIQIVVTYLKFLHRNPGFRRFSEPSRELFRGEPTVWAQKTT